MLKTDKIEIINFILLEKHSLLIVSFLFLNKYISIIIFVIVITTKDITPIKNGIKIVLPKWKTPNI